jgi:hypothetical protein
VIANGMASVRNIKTGRHRRRHDAGAGNQSRRCCGHQQLRQVAGQGSKVIVSKQAIAANPPGQYSVSPSGPFIQRPVATSLLMAAILLVGIVAYTQLPVSALAGGRLSDHPGADVLSGRQPDVMATTVTAPLERQFGQLQG